VNSQKSKKISSRKEDFLARSPKLIIQNDIEEAVRN